MQLNRMFSRIRLVRPYRLTVTNTRIYLQPRLLTNSTRQNRSNVEQNNPNKVETKLDKTLGSKGVEVAKAAGSGYTGDQFLDKKEGSGSFASTSSSSSSSSSSPSSSSSSSSLDSKQSSSSSSSPSSAFPSGSYGSSSSEKSSSYDRFSPERGVDTRTSGANFADRSSSQSSGSQFQPQSHAQSQSFFGGRSTSSSDSLFGQRATDDSDRASRSGSRQSGEFGTDYKSSGRGGGSFGEMASKVADKVADTFSGGSGAFSQTVSKMAEKVADKFSGSGDKSSDRSYEDRSNPLASSYSQGGKAFSESGRSSSSENDRSFSEAGRSSSESGRSSSESGRYSSDSDRFSESGRSSEGGRSFSEAGRSSSEGGRAFSEGERSSGSGGSYSDSFNRMANKAADTVSSAGDRASESGRSGIGETLHKISDKISDTFSGQSSGDNAEGKMMRSSPRRGRDRDSLFNPFDLSSIFRSNFFDNLDSSMRTDIVERDSDYRIICDMPGVDKKNINITMRNNYLEIYGERADEGYDESDQTVHRQERYFGSYTRRLALPEDAAKEMSNIKARCENGVLTVTIPKSQRSSSRDRYNINIE